MDPSGGFRAPGSDDRCSPLERPELFARNAAGRHDQSGNPHSHEMVQARYLLLSAVVVADGHGHQCEPGVMGGFLELGEEHAVGGVGSIPQQKPYGVGCRDASSEAMTLGT